MIKNLEMLSKVFPFLFIFFIGCSVNSFSLKQSQDKNNPICYTKPSWAISVPRSKDKIYGVGIAGENINGEAAQRKVAISRALNEIASQLKTTVNSKFESLQSTSGINEAQSYTIQTVDNQVVHAKIVKSCKNPNTGMLYILMESEKK